MAESGKRYRIMWIKFTSYSIGTDRHLLFFFFFLNDPATTEISTLPLPDALPISWSSWQHRAAAAATGCDTPLGPQRHRHALSFHALARAGFAAERHVRRDARRRRAVHGGRSEEHTSELQSRLHLVCRLLLEKKKT